MTRTPFSFELRQDDVIRGDLWMPPETTPGAAVVVSHGFKGFKDWGFFPYLCETLANHIGVLVVGFNFSGCGIGEDPETFTELERFAHNTLSRELEDLGEVLDRLAGGSIGGNELSPIKRFGLMGHSRGGVATIATTVGRRDVTCAVTWAAISNISGYADNLLPQLEVDGVAWITNARTGQQLPLKWDIVDDIRKNGARLDVIGTAASIEVPLLVIHGDADETVSVESAKAIKSAAGAYATLEIIEGAGHTMNVGHPFQGAGPELDRAIDLTVATLRGVIPEAE